MSADYSLAIPMFVPTNDLFTTNTHQAIVIHKTASGNTAQDIAQYFINASPGPSVHYVVGLDGTVIQCAPESMGAGGNCCLEPGHDPFWDQFGGVNLNTVTLSIEHVDPASDNSTPCPQAQIDASFKLVAHLAQKYGIAADHIKPHSSLDPISRARCPGNYPFDQLIAYVKNGGMNTMGVPNGWHDDGSTLTAPNGHKVRLGFRDYILNYPGGWDPENQPQCEEYHQDPVEYSNPSLGPGQKLPCTKDTLEYTDARGVFKAWQGQEIYALTQLLTKAQQPAPPQPALNLSDAVQVLKSIPTDAAAKVAQILKDLGVS